MMIFLICGQFMRHPLTELFHLSNLLQKPNNYKLVDVEFFGNFSCSCKRISFEDPLNWLLPILNGQPFCSSSSRLMSPLQNFLNHYYTVRLLAIPGLNVCRCCKLSLLLYDPFRTWIKNCSNKFAFLSNIISVV